ncbi:B3 domain-containing protein [Panicum miliaceum]|uniref:B3 domain-containing protein n=1 Tax=Panicum miliaceum TaxID=4540 RepID=A0A3L6Q0D2_PANMI|nr:B3 domain-containing protein [Panicum miliaceum]
MVTGRKKQQGSSGAAATPEKESGKGKEKAAREDGKEREKEEVTGASKKAAKSKEPAKEKQKQKGKQKEAREDGKEMAKAKQQQEKVEAAAKSAGQQFFKIFFPNQSGERLKIPASFHQHLQEQPTGLVSLKGPSGNTWEAVLTSDSKGLCFGQGWKEFVTDHSVKQGHFLVFTYDGLSRFSVTVFGSLGVVDPPALVAKPTNDVVIKIEDDEEVQGGMDAGGTSETSILPQEEGNGTRRKRTRGVNNDLLEGGNASKRHSSVAKNAKKRPEAIPRTSKDASTIDNTEKGTPFLLLDESMAFNKTQVREKNMPRLGKFIVRRARQPVVISQRRPVTQEEKDLALRRAKEFKSKNPFAVQTMMESYVYVGFFMNITCDFVRESLPRKSKKMTLWDPLGKPWEVNYVYYSDRSVASFSGGWGKFALGNNLEKFDVCVFELFKEDNIKVHIYRVVPEITPLLRASSKD